MPRQNEAEIAYYRKTYSQGEYFQTSHWRLLNRKLIVNNNHSKCFICSKTNTLLLHHIRYDNLFNERLGRDVYILCFNCHQQVHFYSFLFIFKRKTPLERKRLMKRLYYLKIKYCIRKLKPLLCAWYILRYIMS